MSQPHDVLYVPEETLPDLIKVIREGLKRADVSEDTREGLEDWCIWQQEWLDKKRGDPKPV